MDYKATAETILANVGGKENIKSVVHCATRLRIALNDSSLVSTEAILNDKSVLQVIQLGGQYQIVIGPQVAKLYNELIVLGGFRSAEALIDPAAAKEDRHFGIRLFFKNLFSSKKAPADDGILYAPVPGEVITLAEVEDDAFSSGVLGPGLAIIPSAGEVYAPCGGTLTTLPSSGHAVGITTPNGAEILIHVGMDTVSLKGEGFTPVVKEGKQVEKGQLLLRFDMDFIKSKGLSTVTPVVIANSDEFNAKILPEKGAKVDSSVPVIIIK